MLKLFLCLTGIFVLLVITELLNFQKKIKGEYHRKFFHITAGSFIAFWPWLLSWETTQVLSLLMVAFAALNRYLKLFNYHGRIPRVTYGDIFFAVAIFISSLITDNKTFFAIAILEVALADGLAAVIGIANGHKWQYRVFSYKKTVIGTMVFWLASLEILAAGLIGLHSTFSYQDYYYLLLLLPPFLTLVENLAILGIDNLIIPIATISVLALLANN